MANEVGCGPHPATPCLRLAISPYPLIPPKMWVAIDAATLSLVNIWKISTRKRISTLFSSDQSISFSSL